MNNIETKDALVVLDAASRAAVAGSTNTSTSAKLIAEAMNSYHLPAEKVNDILFAAKLQGGMSIDELAENMGPLLPNAARLNIPMQDIAAALSTLKSLNYTLPDAMEMLKNVFNELLINSGKFSNAGINIDHVKGLTDWLKAIQDITKGNDKEIEVFMEDPQTRKAVMGLIGKNADKYTQKVTNINNNTNGAAGSAFAKEENTLMHQDDLLFDQIDAFIVDKIQDKWTSLRKNIDKTMSELVPNPNSESDKAVDEKYSESIKLHKKIVKDNSDAVTAKYKEQQEAIKALNNSKITMYQNEIKDIYNVVKEYEKQKDIILKSIDEIQRKQQDVAQWSSNTNKSIDQMLKDMDDAHKTPEQKERDNEIDLRSKMSDLSGLTGNLKNEKDIDNARKMVDENKNLTSGIKDEWTKRSTLMELKEASNIINEKEIEISKNAVVQKKKELQDNEEKQKQNLFKISEIQEKLDKLSAKPTVITIEMQEDALKKN
ncbi:MAG: phage tail tape measure protein [Nitrospirae bacterium]|nr:phage tail tape measure protein [Nitrospirota bacterium]